MLEQKEVTSRELDDNIESLSEAQLLQRLESMQDDDAQLDLLKRLNPSVAAAYLFDAFLKGNNLISIMPEELCDAVFDELEDRMRKISNATEEEYIKFPKAVLVTVVSLSRRNRMPLHDALMQDDDFFLNIIECLQTRAGEFIQGEDIKVSIEETLLYLAIEKGSPRVIDALLEKYHGDLVEPIILHALKKPLELLYEVALGSLRSKKHAVEKKSLAYDCQTELAKRLFRMVVNKHHWEAIQSLLIMPVENAKAIVMSDDNDSPLILHSVFKDANYDIFRQLLNLLGEDAAAAIANEDKHLGEPLLVQLLKRLYEARDYLGMDCYWDKTKSQPVKMALSAYACIQAMPRESVEEMIIEYTDTFINLLLMKDEPAWNPLKYSILDRCSDREDIFKQTIEFKIFYTATLVEFALKEAPDLVLLLWLHGQYYPRLSGMVRQLYQSQHQAKIHACMHQLRGGSPSCEMGDSEAEASTSVLQYLTPKPLTSEEWSDIQPNLYVLFALRHVSGNILEDYPNELMILISQLFLYEQSEHVFDYSFQCGMWYKQPTFLPPQDPCSAEEVGDICQLPQKP